MKKNVFFRALPELPNPLPLTPIRATWSFFSDVKIQDLKVNLKQPKKNLKQPEKTIKSSIHWNF